MKISRTQEKSASRQPAGHQRMNNSQIAQHWRVKQILNGQGLSSQQRLETLMQYNDSDMRIHTNSETADKVGAKAFTKGREIHFAPGQYNPHSTDGRHLIAHELTHLLQQQQQKVKATGLRMGYPVNKNPSLESEAETVGQWVAGKRDSVTLNLPDTGISNSADTTHSVMQMDDKNSGGFNIDFSWLPPKLQMQLWVLALDANTSRVRLSKDFGQISTGFNFSYKGNLSADIGVDGFKGSVGGNPFDSTLSASGSYKGFNIGASTNLEQRSFGLNFGYGVPLIPFPTQLSSIFSQGGAGVSNVLGNIGGVANNPLSWYGVHSNDVSAISTAVDTGQKIYQQQTSQQSFSTGLSISYSPSSGFLIYGGVQLRF